MDAQEMSASTPSSSDPTCQHSKTELHPMITHPTSSCMEKAQSGPTHQFEASESEQHRPSADTKNAFAMPSTGMAATGSLSIRRRPPSDPNMLPSSPTPSVLSQANRAPSAQETGLFQQTCEVVDISKQSDIAQAERSVALPNQLGNLHKRRAEASPEKFNTGQFEPLQPQALTSKKRIRTEDGTPRDVMNEHPPSQNTQLTAILSNFNLTPSTSKHSFDDLGRHITSSQVTLRPQLPLTSELTAGLDQFNFATPKAYTIPLSAIPPTPAPNKKKKSNGKFSLLMALCANNELLLLLTSYLNIPCLISLYAISKVYHHQFNCHYTAHILAIMRTWAPHSEVIFPWRSYDNLCTKDPKLRQNSRLKDEEQANEYGDVRQVPTIRWLQMVVYRHGVCTDMLIRLASYGHRCPAGTLDALKVRRNHPACISST